MKTFIKYVTIIGAFALIGIMMVLPNDMDRAEAQFHSVVDSIESNEGLHAAILYCQDKQAEAHMESHQYCWATIILNDLESKINPDHIERVDYMVNEGKIQSAINYCNAELNNPETNHNSYKYFERKLKELQTMK